MIEASAQGSERNDYLFAVFHFLRGKALMRKAPLSTESKGEAFDCMCKAEEESIRSFGSGHPMTMQVQYELLAWNQ